MSRALAGAAALLLAVALSACASRGPALQGSGSGSRVHVVRPGETVWGISKRYGSSVDAVTRANALRDSTQIRVGQRLIVPLGVRGRAPSASRASKGAAGTWTGSDKRGMRGSTHAFGWPVQGRLTSRYGVRSGAHHDGVDISAPTGTRIRAAEAGRVIHSGNGLAGYGNLIILKHSGDYSTVYAHNRRNLVRVGDFVEKGQTIGEVGQSGRASAPHLHFEVRRDGRARDPLHYLP